MASIRVFWGTLFYEHFQEKWIPVFRPENAAKKRAFPGNSALGKQPAPTLSVRRRGCTRRLVAYPSESD